MKQQLEKYIKSIVEKELRKGELFIEIGESCKELVFFGQYQGKVFDIDV